MDVIMSNFTNFTLPLILLGQIESNDGSLFVTLMNLQVPKQKFLTHEYLSTDQERPYTKQHVP
jgi:hypothetical protein